MRTESEIFLELSNLCTSPGYVHAIAFFCFRDNTTLLSTLETKNRLIRNEISTLIGLMIKSPINYDMTSPDILEDYITKTEYLLSEMQQAFYNPSIIEEQFSNNSFSVGNMLRESMFYGPESAYTFQYSEMAVERYKADNQWLENNKSFSITDVKRVYTSIEKIQNNKLNEIYKELKNIAPDNWRFLPIFTFTVEDILRESGIPISKIISVLEAFTLSFENQNNDFCSMNDFNSANSHPVLKKNNNEYILFQVFSMAESMYESPYFWFNQDNSYRQLASKNRGSFTEEFCQKCLQQVFGLKNVFGNVEIYASKNKKLCEIDVLAIFGNRLIIVQTKSKRLTLESRKGQDGHIKEDFKKSVQDAYDQGLKCAKSLSEHSYTKLADNTQQITIPSNVKEIYIICVVAEHYPSLHFQTRQFLKFETTQMINPPLVLDVFSIDAITEMLQSPLYFLSYLNRRVNYTTQLIASNEISVLAYHLKRNLWISDDSVMYIDDTLAIDLDHSMAVRRLGMSGNFTPEGILTRLRSTVFYRIIKQIDFEENHVAIDLGFLLLTLSEECLVKIDQSLQAIVKLWNSDKNSHDFTFLLHSGIGLTFHCNQEPKDKAMIRLQSHCEKRKYYHKADKWFGVTIDPVESSIRFSLLLNSQWEQNNEMDEIVRDMKDIAHSPVMSNSSDEKRKTGRNESCPCKSGLKYKKCCLYKNK